MKNNHLKSLALALATVGMLASCADEPVDLSFEQAKNEYHLNWLKTFGPIDPKQTWNMATTVEARIDKSVFSDNYTFIIYDDDPDYGGKMIGMSHHGEPVKLDMAKDAYDIYALAYDTAGNESRGFYTIKNGTVDINIKYTESCEENVANSRAAHTPSKFDWMLAFEDLGSTGDYDFNDVVIGVNHVAGSGILKLTPMAAGGTLETYVLFKGNRVTPEVHSWLSGKDGAPITTMLNTTAYRIMSKDQITINVDEDWNLAENLGDISLEVNGKKETFVITKPESGKAPQMICLKGDWYWPKETLDIKEVFPSFKTWSGNADATGWMDNFDDLGNVVPWEYKTTSKIYGKTLNYSSFDVKYNGTPVRNSQYTTGMNGGTTISVPIYTWTEVPSDIFSIGFNNSMLEELDLTEFDSSNLTTMKGMFSGSSLSKIKFGNFYTSNVTDMQCMFGGTRFENLDLSIFDTSKVTDMSAMFIGCNQLASLNLKNFDTSSVTNMSSMFWECSSLASLDLSNFNTANVTSMGNMFQSCYSLANLDISNFDTSGVESMMCLFYSCKSLTSLDVTHFNTSNVTSMEGVFRGCSSLQALDVTNFDTSNVTTMYSMFAQCSRLESLDLTHFDTSNVKSMAFMFAGCSSLKSLDLSNFDTSSVTNLRLMFSNCSSLRSLDLSNFDTSNVNITYESNLEKMFLGCRSDLTIKCKRAFRDWCIYYATVIRLPFNLCDPNSDQWIIVD